MRPAGKPLLEVQDLTTRFEIRAGLFGKVSNRIDAVENVSCDGALNSSAGGPVNPNPILFSGAGNGNFGASALAA